MSGEHLDELRALVASGELREDVYRELVRINSRESLGSSSKPPGPNNMNPRASLVRRPLSIIKAAAPPKDEDAVVVTEGWLFMRTVSPNNSKSSWKRKFVTLYYTRFEWSNAAPSTGLKRAPVPKDQICFILPHQAVSRSEEDVLQFEISYTGLEFSADSEADIKRWTSELRRVIALIKSAKEKNLPSMLDRPSRTLSQVSRDSASREEAARKARVREEEEEDNEEEEEEKKAELVISSMTISGAQTAPRSLSQTSQDWIATKDLRELRERDLAIAEESYDDNDDESSKEVSDCQQMLAEAIAHKQTQVLEMNDRVEREISCSQAEKHFLDCTMQEFKQEEIVASETVFRLRRDESAIAERIAVLVREEVDAACALDLAAYSSPGSVPPPSIALQALIAKDAGGVVVSSNTATTTPHGQLLYALSNCKRALQTERERAKRNESERVKAEQARRQARLQVSEAQKQASELARQTLKASEAVLASRGRLNVAEGRVQHYQQQLQILTGFTIKKKASKQTLLELVPASPMTAQVAMAHADDDVPVNIVREVSEYDFIT